MALTPRHGKSAFFSITTSTGGVVTMSSGLNDAGLSRTVDTAEVTTFGDSDKEYLAGLRDASFSLSGNFTSTQSQTWTGNLGASTAPSFVYGPEGNTTGYRKYTGSVIVTGYDESSPIGDKISASISLQATGVITATVF